MSTKEASSILDEYLDFAKFGRSAPASGLSSFVSRSKVDPILGTPYAIFAIHAVIGAVARQHDQIQAGLLVIDESLDWHNEIVRLVNETSLKAIFRIENGTLNFRSDLPAKLVQFVKNYVRERSKQSFME